MKTVQKTGAPPVAGKTFSLFGTADSTEGYFRAVRELADTCLRLQPDIEALIAEVRRVGKRPRLALRLSRGGSASLSRSIVQKARAFLATYTTAVSEHLRELSFIKRFDGVIAFTEEQYHLAMLEIELMNRAFAHAFRHAGRKLAFLPIASVTLRRIAAQQRATSTMPAKDARPCAM